MIEISDLTKYYGDLCALDHINLSIRAGEIMGLLGPNGAGKSTTVKLITGILRPISGNVKVASFEVSENLGEVRR